MIKFINDLKASGVSPQSALDAWNVKVEAEEKRLAREAEEKRLAHEEKRLAFEAEEKRQASEVEVERQLHVASISKDTSLSDADRSAALAALRIPSNAAPVAPAGTFTCFSIAFPMFFYGSSFVIYLRNSWFCSGGDAVVVLWILRQSLSFSCLTLTSSL